MSMFDAFSEMRTPSVASGILHVGVVLVAVLGLPLFAKPDLPEPEPMIVDFEEIGPKSASPTVGKTQPTTRAPIAKEATPAPPPTTSDPPPSPKPEQVKPPEKAERPVPAPAPQPTPAVQKAQEPDKPQPDPDLALKPVQPEPPKVEPPKPSPPQTPEVRKPEPPKEPPKVAQPPKPAPPPPKPTKSADSIIDALVNKQPTPQPHKPVENAPKPAQPTRTATAAPTHAQRLTSSEMAAMADKVRPCWNINPDAMDARTMVVEVIVDMAQDGTVTGARLGDGIRISGAQHQAFAQAALRAVQNPRCQPLPYPQGKYEALRQFIFRFDPRDL